MDGALHCSGDDGVSWRRYDDGLGTTGGDPLLAAHPKSGVFVAGSADGSLFQLRDVANREFVSGQVYFASGSAAPRKSLLPFLKQLGRALQQNRRLRVRVEGHTDADGGDQYNLELSQKRSSAVAEHLVQFGATRGQVQTFGYGETRPLFANTTSQNKQRNRRVEILTIDQNSPSAIR